MINSLSVHAAENYKVESALQGWSASAAKSADPVGSRLINAPLTGELGSIKAQEQIASLLPLLSALIASLNQTFNSKPKAVDVPVNNRLLKDKLMAETIDKTAPVTPKFENYPGFSNKKVGEVPDNIWNGVMFGLLSNESTLAVIKAAMMKYGQSPLGIYKSVEITSKGYDIVMRDGFKLSLTFQEVGHARLASKYSYSDMGMGRDVAFLYAVSTKRAQIENKYGDTEKGHDQAIQFMNARLDPMLGFKLLGLEGDLRPTTYEKLMKGGVGIVVDGNTNFALEGKRDGCTRPANFLNYGEYFELV
ncbi:hypothetical protein [Pseudomonas sp. Z18(2022)]|uniref:hypothetical protein n=1 Tax=Pseudomonas sp. Z18(2022) TaxID=2983410 RepID=UPI002E8139CE|nr:hypothetical protein [Pseudomonas sp. Z18(2022)]